MSAIVLEPVPAWIPCSCESWWCTLHEQHASDCDCPEIEAWQQQGLDPYAERPVQISDEVILTPPGPPAS